MAYIGARLRELRKAKGLTQARLGELAEMPRTDISAAENDKIPIGADRLRRLAAALTVSALELSPEAEPDQTGLDLRGRQEGLEAEVRRLIADVDNLTGHFERLTARVELLERQEPHESPRAGRR